MVGFTKAFEKSARPVKGIRVVKRKFLLQTLPSERGDSSSALVIWTNLGWLVDLLTGKKPLPALDLEIKTHQSPKCGKVLVEKTPPRTAVGSEMIRISIYVALLI